MKNALIFLVGLWFAMLRPALAGDVVWVWDTHTTEWGSYNSEFRLFVQCDHTDVEKVPPGPEPSRIDGKKCPNGHNPPPPPGNLASLTWKTQALLGPGFASASKVTWVLSSPVGAQFENAVRTGDKATVYKFIDAAPRPEHSP